MIEVLDRFAAIDFGVNSDVATIAELKSRIARRARTARSLQTYSELVHDVVFQLPSVNNGEPFEITEWTGPNREIIGDYLGQIAADSYRAGGFLAAALVVQQEHGELGEPSRPFFHLATRVGLLHGDSRGERSQFFWQQTQAAVDWFNANREARW
jgi:hypothetical protein